MTTPVSNPSIPVNGMRVTASGAGGTGDIWANVYSLRNVSGGPYNFSQIAEAFRAHYDRLATGGLFPTGWTLTSVMIRSLEFSGPRQDEFTYSLAGVSGNPLPPQIAACVTHRSAVASRRGRGRTFIGPLAAGTLATSGKFVAGVKTTTESSFTTLRGALAAQGVELAVWSRLDDELRTVVSSTTGGTPDTIRRRRSAIRG